MSNKENNVPHAGSMWENWETYENKAPAIKIFLNLLGKFLLPGEANFVSATMFPVVDKQKKIDRKRNVSATTFPSLPKA